MEKQIKHLATARKFTLGLIEGLSFEQLCKIPEGFNNNILWNVGHLAVTQQLICYGLSGLPMEIEKDAIDSFRKGSKPKDQYTKEEWDYILEKFSTLPSKFQEDLSAAKFKEYKPYLTSFGAQLDSITDAAEFNNIHEGLHIGYILALKHLV